MKVPQFKSNTFINKIYIPCFKNYDWILILRVFPLLNKYLKSLLLASIHST